MAQSTITPEAVGELALAAIEAVARPETWTDLCDRVAHEIDARAFFVIAYDLDTHAMPRVFGSSAIHSPAGVALSKAGRLGAGAEDGPLYEKIARQSPGRVMSEHDLYCLPEDEPLPSNPWRERMLSVTGGHARCLMKLNDVGPFLDCAAVHDRNVVSGHLSAISPIVYPILSRALATTRTVATLSKSYARLMSLFDRLDFGAAFCTPDGQVLAANPAFRCITSDCDGLNEMSGMIYGGEFGASAALRSMLATAARADAGPEGLTLTIPRRSSPLPLVLHAAPVSEKELGPATAVLLVALDPEDDRRLNTRGLAAFEVLTPSELEVCEFVIRGYETGTISTRRDTSRDTTRDHIKAATAKLSCRSRLDLLRLAMASSTPLRDNPLSAE